MKSVYQTKKDCCGCSACYNICPTDAIAMTADEEGFLYPEIDELRCIDCGKCTRVCPFIKEDNFKYNGTPKFYVARHKYKEVLWNSSSGGAFTTVSDAILQQNGVVYGADFNEDFQVVHRRAETVEQRNRMRISKYSQSDLGDIFTQIKSDLQKGRVVLFTGTPCQTAGLRGFIGDSSLREQLYICDLICHSIPSPLIWEEYKRLLEREQGGKITSVQFRSKKDGWSRENSNKGMLFTTDNSPEVHEDDRFYKLFIDLGCVARPSCPNCPFTDIYRASDLTIADYFGIEKYAPEWFDSLGVSLVLVNSSKGAKLFTQCSKDMYYQERPKEEALNEQKRLNEPLQTPENRQQFWENYRNFGFERILFGSFRFTNPKHFKRNRKL